jgi:uncharacterized protein YdaU (DUF1376 family)
MAKDPAFLFYTNDFASGTQFFTDEQLGKYMRLLMAQHQHGHLSENQVIFICKSYDNHVMSKFVKDSNGLWFNERLEIEIEKRKNYVSSRSKNKEGKTKERIISKSYDSHMENEYRNEDVIELNIKGAFDEIYLEGQKMKWSHIDFPFQFKAFIEKVRGSPSHYASHTSDGLRLALQSQLRNAKMKPNGYSKAKHSPADLATAFAERVRADAAAGKFQGS